MLIYLFGLMLGTLYNLIITEERILLDKESVLFIVFGYHGGQSVSEGFPVNVP